MDHIYHDDDLSQLAKPNSRWMATAQSQAAPEGRWLQDVVEADVLHYPRKRVLCPL